MDYSLEQSRLLQCRDFYTQNYAKQIDFAGSFAIYVLTGVRNKFQGYEPAKIGVGPPPDPKSRDTLGRILDIFAAVCHRVYYRFTDSVECLRLHLEIPQGTPVYFTMTILSSKSSGK